MADRREWWDWLILACAAGVFVALGLQAKVPDLDMNYAWTGILTVVMVASAVVCGWGLKSRRHGSERPGEHVEL